MHCRFILVFVLALVVCITQSAMVAAGDKKGKLPAEATRAISKLDEYLVKKGIPKVRHQRAIVQTKELRSVFPKHTFIAVRYPQFPVAIAPPKGMKSSNVVSVSGIGDLKVLTTEKEVNHFFLNYLNGAKMEFNEANAGVAAKAYLALRQELAQDGFYKFEILKPKTTKNDNGAVTVNGRTVAMRGGNGQITCKITFGPGKKIQIGSSIGLRPGPRPRCQATKLLDRDPIVRYMARTELLFMGRPACDYLMEQSQRANPELREALEQILRTIKKDTW